MKDHGVLDRSDRLRNYPEVQFLSSTGEKLDQDKCCRLVSFAMAIMHDEDALKQAKGSLGNFVLQKFKEALRSEEFADIDEHLAYPVLEYVHKFENSIDASDTWFDTSASGYPEYWECEGHPLLNWKDKGYGSVIDFITVRISKLFKTSISYSNKHSVICRKNFPIHRKPSTLKVELCSTKKSAESTGVDIKCRSNAPMVRPMTVNMLL